MLWDCRRYVLAVKTHQTLLDGPVVDIPKYVQQVVELILAVVEQGLRIDRGIAKHCNRRLNVGIETLGAEGPVRVAEDAGVTPHHEVRGSGAGQGGARENAGYGVLAGRSRAELSVRDSECGVDRDAVGVSAHVVGV